MSDHKTTVCGAICAAAAALTQVSELPRWAHVTAVAVAASAGAMLGFFAKDRELPHLSPPLGAAVLCLALGATLIVGCAVAGFGMRLSAPPFGTVDLAIGGGSIGNRPKPSPPLMTATNAADIGSTNTDTPAGLPANKERP